LRTVHASLTGPRAGEQAISGPCAAAGLRRCRMRSFVAAVADGFPEHAVHFVDGESAGGSVRELLGAPATIVTCHDVLSVGPLRRAASFEDWCADRNEYWRNVLTSAPRPEDDDPAVDLVAGTEHLADADVVVWAGVGTSDQLLLPFLAQLRRWLG